MFQKQSMISTFRHHQQLCLLLHRQKNICYGFYPIKQTNEQKTLQLLGKNSIQQKAISKYLFMLTFSVQSFSFFPWVTMAYTSRAFRVHYPRTWYQWHRRSTYLGPSTAGERRNIYFEWKIASRLAPDINPQPSHVETTTPMIQT